MRRLAVFDLDGTLLDGDSFRSFVRWLYTRKGVARGARGSAIAGAVKRKLRLISHRRFKETMLRPLAGSTREEIERCGREFYETVGRGMVRRDGLARIADCRSEGCTVVLATASPDVYVGSFARSLEIRRYFAARLAYGPGETFTGELSGGLLLGDDKVEQILAGDDGVAIEIAFSDSASDQPLLTRARRPVLVNPSGRLERCARARGWKVESWR